MSGPRAGFTMIEMMIVVGVIAILALMVAPSYQESLIREQIVEALPLADIAKAPIAASWSVAQTFPENNEAAGLPPAEKIVSNLVRSVAIQGGAIQLTFGNRANSSLRDKVLTLRPAVVMDAPVVPVAWVCGNATVPDKMAVKGENKTDIPSILLPLKCRP